MSAMLETCSSSIMTDSVEYAAHRVIEALGAVIEQQHISGTAAHSHALNGAIAGNKLSIDSNRRNARAIIGHKDFDDITRRSQEGTGLNGVGAMGTQTMPV